MILTTDPRQTIGTVHTSVGPAQLVHCYKHPRNVAIALVVAPMEHPEMTLDKWSDVEWAEIKNSFYMTPVSDLAKLLRMLSSMGLCSECVQDAMLAGLPWTRFIYISQRVKNWQTDVTLNYGAFKGNKVGYETYSGIHALGHSIELGFVGQIKSTVEYFCPTCLHEAFSSPTVIKTKMLSSLLDVPQDFLDTNIIAQAVRNIHPPLTKVIGQ